MTRYHQVFVSPHADDAAFSAGGLVALAARAGRRVAVVTVFSHGPDGGARAREDTLAIARLGAERVDLGLPELLARRVAAEAARLPSPTVEDRPLIERVAGRLAELCDGAEVIGPLGIAGHADHQIAFQACARLPGEVAFYEEMPYALAPHVTALRLATLATGVPCPASVGMQIGIARFWFGLPLARELAPAPFRPLAAWIAAGAPTLPPASPVAVVEERVDVSGVMDAKMAAVADYASQWPRFHRSLSGLRAALAGHSRRIGSPHVCERLFRRRLDPAPPVEDGGP